MVLRFLVDSELSVTLCSEAVKTEKKEHGSAIQFTM